MGGKHCRQRVSPKSTDNTVVVDQDDSGRNHARAVRYLIRKLDWRLIPFLSLLQFGSFICQINIGYLKICSMRNDLHLSVVQENWATSLFFLAFFIFEIPSNLLMRSIGPTRYLSWTMIAWGSITVGAAFVKNAEQLLAVRFLLGMAEAGFFAGMIIYISLWYRKREQIMRISVFFGANIASGAFGCILAYGISHMEGIRNLYGWQWIFLLQGLPIISLGFITYFFLGNLPETVQWLTNCEKQILTNILRDDAGVVKNEPELNTHLSWRQVRYVFVDWRIYLYAAISIGNLGVIRCWTIYFPGIIQGMSDTKENALLMSALPYLLACISTLICGFSSSRKYEHGYHLTFSLAVSALGFVLMAALVDKSKAAMYMSICIACCGTFTAFPLLLSWLTNNVGGHTKRALAVGFLTGLGKIGGIVAPLIYHGEDTSAHRQGHIICASATIVALLITLLLRFALKKENHRRKYLTQDQYERETQIIEPCDWHPDVRYIL